MAAANRFFEWDEGSDSPGGGGGGGEIRRHNTHACFGPGAWDAAGDDDDDDGAERTRSELITQTERAVGCYFLFEPGLFTGRSVYATWMWCLNAVVGAGLLGLPYAFHGAGLGPSVVLLGVVTALGMATANYLLETQNRLQALVNLITAKQQQTAAAVHYLALNGPAHPPAPRPVPLP